MARDPLKTVLHVITRFEKGGSPQRVRDIVAALPDHHHCLVVGERTAEVPAEVEVLDLPALRRSIDPPNDVRTIAKLRAMLATHREGSWVVAHQSKSHLLVGIALAGCLPRRRPRLALSLSMSPTNEPGGGGYWRVQRRLDGALRPLALAVGQHVAYEYEARTRSPRVRVVRSSLSLAPFLEAGRERVSQALDGEVVLLYVGSLEERKGVLLLAPIAAEVARRLGRPVSLRIAGEGILRTQLEQMRSPADVSVSLLGYRRDVAELMGSADALVLPSRSEGLPQVLVQAAAARLPFACAPVTGASELVQLGMHGVIAAGRDVGDMAAAVVGACFLRPPEPHADLFGPWAPATVHAQYRELLNGAEGNGLPRSAR